MKPSGIEKLQTRIGLGGAATFFALIVLNYGVARVDPNLSQSTVGLAFYAPLIAVLAVFVTTAVWRSQFARVLQWVILVGYGLFVQSFSGGLTGTLIIGAGVILAAHYGFFSTRRAIKVAVVIILVLGSLVVNALATAMTFGGMSIIQQVLQTLVYMAAMGGLVYAYGLVVRESVLITAERQAELEHEVALRTEDLQHEVESRRAAEARATALAEERLVLIGEIQHRAKNSLQMALTLVEQMECDERDGTLARIRAIGLVYDMVEGQENLSVIALGEYLQSLSSSLSMLYGATPVSIRFAADGTLEAGLDSTVNTGLMLVELVDLARRYSFSAEGGEISVSQKLGEEMVELVVTHAGGRLPDSVDPGADRFFTTGLLPAFFERLQVSATLERGDANEWTLTMPASVFRPHKGDSAVLAS